MRVAVEVHPYECLSQSLREAEPGSTDLLVMPAHWPLIRTALSEGKSAVLACPARWSPSSRFSVLDDGQPDCDSYMGRALVLCRALRIIPILLTWAWSQHEALERQERVRHILGDSGPFVVFDTVIGGDLRAAVANLARWRKCQMVIACHSRTQRWLRWLQASSAERLVELADSLAVLALPAAATARRGAAEGSCLAAEASLPPTALLNR